MLSHIGRPTYATTALLPEYQRGRKASCHFFLTNIINTPLKQNRPAENIIDKAIAPILFSDE